MINWCDFFLGAAALLVTIVVVTYLSSREESKAFLRGEIKELNLTVDSLSKDIYIHKLEVATLRAEYNQIKEKIDGKNG